METNNSKYCGCLYYSANALSRVLTKMAEEEFSITGLAPSYAFLLMTVNEFPGIHPKEISEFMKLAPSTVSRLIEKMEHQGYLTRKSKGKTIQVFPSFKSKTLNKKIKSAWQNLYKRYSLIIGEENGILLTSSIYNAYNKLSI